jgi:hypothetical protein
LSALNSSVIASTREKKVASKLNVSGINKILNVNHHDDEFHSPVDLVDIESDFDTDLSAVTEIESNKKTVLTS